MYLPKEVKEVFERGWFTDRLGAGVSVTKLERLLAEKEGCEYCCVYSGGTPSLIKKLIEINRELIELRWVWNAVEKICVFEGWTGPHWCLFTNNKDAYTRLKQLGSQGYAWDREKTYEFDFIGYNLRCTELDAAILYYFFKNGKVKLREVPRGEL